MKKKILALCLVVALMATAIAGATLAYFTDTTENVKNTFTVGEITIKLDEAKVNPETGEKITGEGADRVTANTYNDIHPGQTLDKDPTVWVKADSEDCYVRIKATIPAENYEKLATAFPDAKYWMGGKVGGVFLLEELVDESADWNCVKAENGVYEFWYKAVVEESDTETKLDPLFTKITLPGDMTNPQIAALEGFNITFVGHAIQAAEFANATAAWDAFDKLPEADQKV